MSDPRGLESTLEPIYWPRWPRVGLVVLVCLGWVLLFWNSAQSVTLFMDETMLLVNVIELDIVDYAGPLGDRQVAPFGFLLAERFAIRVFGLSEWSVRLVPLVAGLLSVPLFALLVWRLSAPLPGLVVLAGFVASQSWLLQACRAKPYTLDVLFGLLALWLGVWLWSRRWGWREGLVASLLAGVGVWFSIPFYIMLAGVGGVLLGAGFVRGGRELAWIVLAGAVGLCSGAVHFFWVLRPQMWGDGTGHYMASYWENGFLVMPWRAPRSWLHGLSWAADYSTGLALPGLVLGLAGLGVMGLVARREWRGALLVAPVLLAIVISMAERYPLTDRLALYLAGPVLLLVALGLAQVGRAIEGRGGTALVLLVGLALLSRPVQGRGSAPFEDDVMPVFAHVDAHYEPGQWVYLYNGALPPYDFYTRYLDADFAFPADRVIRGGQYREDWTRYTDEVASLRSRGDVWIVMSHVYRYAGIDEEQFFKMLLDRYGERLEEYRGVGAFAILWRADPQGPAPPVSADDGVGRDE